MIQTNHSYLQHLVKEWQLLAAASLSERRIKGAGAEGNLAATGIDMSMFANFLTSFLGRTVINKTGFTQTFDAQVVFNPTDEALGGFRDAINEQPTVELAGSSIFTALQEQLGVRLESSKGPVQVLVIDSLQKPSEN